ncbi:uroporphyrinogen-III C-methyltransferase [Herminiimonas sp. CN]|uniref:uroporphyrinogen-III C-methyltransferase n=1 Tax=Herminiimonas sp. CN TaxID=1349818 RepID=UPI000473F76F|nr:uroporphyrinogen-III C-methyltransferase [Herminiimonas sp. CN]
MNETPNPLESHQPVKPVAAVGANRSMQLLLPAGFLVLLLLLAAQWWASKTELGNVREELARRLRSADAVNSETRLLAKTGADNLKEIQAKVNVLESKQVEAQGQQLALEQLYQDLSRTRDEWTLAEIEQVLSTASQQLQLAGNVPGALIALQNADTRLSSSDKPQFIQIRRAIASDLEKLKSLPNLDLAGIALRLDSAIAQIDSMPLLADEKPPAPEPKPRHAAPKATKAGGAKPANQADGARWLLKLQDIWHQVSTEMWGDLQQLVRVRSVESPEALLLSPTQDYYARENLKLRLLNARLALLSRNDSVFRSDMIAAQDAIAKYFDTRAKRVQTVQALLKQVQGSNLSIEMPTLSNSLNAVRNYKVKR